LKEIVVISGKGGTGKTSIVAAFAALAKNAVLADCDVDAADLHLLLSPKIKQEYDFSGGKQASIVAEKCTGCGKCRDLCRFEAISLDGPANDVVDKTFTVDAVSCEGCKVCVEFCPVSAIEFNDSINGQWFISETRFGPMVHARLGIAQANSGKLVSLIRKQAKRLAAEQNRSLIIVDGSPGIGCPVIASIAGADMVLVVTEPTVSARHDLGRVLELAEHFAIPVAIAINKYDINCEVTTSIEKMAARKELHLAGKISYDSEVTEAQIEARTIVEYSTGNLKDQVSALWESVAGYLGLVA
jgi:MinD superfamily P-loop ATPase